MSDDLKNTRAEFIEHIKDRVVQCASIEHIAFVGSEKRYRTVASGALPCDYTPAEYEAFLQSIDFEYDAGFGEQELYGYIWYVDGTWSDRYEYDGDECWVHQERPEIPKELQR